MDCTTDSHPLSPIQPALMMASFPSEASLDQTSLDQTSLDHTMAETLLSTVPMLSAVPRSPSPALTESNSAFNTATSDCKTASSNTSEEGETLVAKEEAPQKANGQASLTPRSQPPAKKLKGEDYGVSDFIPYGIFSLENTNLPPAAIEPVMAPFNYIKSLPSKGVRDKLIAAINVWVDIAPSDLEQISAIIADVHNLSLMLDDVQDNSPIRRAKPATHCVFGMPQTVNSATYQIVDVIARAAEFRNQDSFQAVIDEMKNLMVGQGHDLVWTHLVEEPEVSDYLRMVDGKTGGLFRMISRLMIAQSTSQSKPASLDKLMTLFGRFFQIRDDLANLTSEQYAKSKGFAEDLDEGKYSFVLIHALLNSEATSRKILQNLLIQRRAAGMSVDCHKNLIIELMKNAASLATTTQILVSLQGKLEEEISHMEMVTGKSNHFLRDILNALKL